MTGGPLLTWLNLRRLCVRTKFGLVTILVLALAAGCSPLATLDAIAPRDAGALAARGISYGAHPRQKLDVHLPVERSAGPAPVAVFFYGGSWKGGSKDDYDFAGAALAAQGFVTIIPDYRLYPEVRFPDFLDDSAAAVRWASDNAATYGGDGRRIVLVGHSAGGYNAAMLALDGRYLRRAGVDRRAIRAVAGLSGPYDFLPLDEGTAQEVFGQAPNLPATQPITFAGRGSPPAFLATGDADTTVRPRNTSALAARLRSVGGIVEERVYPGLSHIDTLLTLSRPFRGKAPLYDEMGAFLRAQAGEGRRSVERR